MSARLCPGGTVEPAGLEVQEQVLERLAHTPPGSPLRDYLRNRLVADKIPTCVRGAVPR